MSDAVATQPNHDTKTAGATDPYRRIAEMARATKSRNIFCSKALRIIAQSFASPYAAIDVSWGAQVVHDDCHYGPTDPEFWKPSVQLFLNESMAMPSARAKLLNPKRGGHKVAFLSAPIFDIAYGEAG